ncbi:hypothetical protein Sfulv_27810 [Streptomyces fulvorobeus]|uniref:DUF4232 domain-containing protein n=1 Tax=Streptomyces fulvorobeus TaxID=284028 RepID=A0A7J0C675_9ACTN|nr:hypothetical protein Sfulv_27810 [Streptomyces fulvorobeus]
MNHGSENAPNASSEAQGQVPDQEPTQEVELEPEVEPEVEPGREPEVRPAPELERDVAPQPQPQPEPHGVQARDTAAVDGEGDAVPPVDGRDDGEGAGAGDGEDDPAGTRVLTGLFGRVPAAGAEAVPEAEAGLDELALRRMLRGAVQDLAPSSGTLDHLHRAVPARRARRRQAVVGFAAAALLIGTAVPAFVHVARSDGDTGVNSAIAGHGEQAQGGSGEEPDEKPDGGKESGPADEVTDSGEGEPDVSASPSEDGATVPGPEAGGGGVVDAPRSEAAAVPGCGPGQLGVVSAESGAPGADGVVYGTFRISNVSATECSVSGDGSVGVQTTGAADPLRVQVVKHAAGDPAAGLPDPATEPGTVTLKPAMAYEVRFAWVPSDTCPVTEPTPTPTPTDDGAAGSTGDGTASEGTGTQFGGEDGGTMDGGIAVTHTPEAGSPSAQTTITNACAGTVYRTGVLPASQ